MAQTGTVRFCQCGSPATLVAMARIEADIARRQTIAGMTAAVGMFAGFALAPRAQPPERSLLPSNLRLLDGNVRSLPERIEIPIDSARIVVLARLRRGPQTFAPSPGGSPAIPGLIDCHWHSRLIGASEVMAMPPTSALSVRCPANRPAAR